MQIILNELPISIKRFIIDFSLKLEIVTNNRCE